MTSLLSPFLEGIENQLKLNDPLVIQQTLNRLIDSGYPVEKAKELLCENLFIETMTILEDGIPFNKERYINNMMNLPMLNYDIETAFIALDRNRRGIPFHAIEFLYNHPRNEKISEKIFFALKNAYDEDLVYDPDRHHYLPFPLWYAIVAENHLSENLIDPVINLFTTTDKDWDFLNEQGQYLLVKLAEKFPEPTIEKVVAAIEKQVKLDSKNPYLFLFDTLFYADLEKYGKRLLAILAHPKNYWKDSFASHIAHLQIKEAIPVLQQLIENQKNNKDEFSEISLREYEGTLEQLQNGKVKYPEFSRPYFQDREFWKDYYLNFEKSFNDNSFSPGEPQIKTNKVQRNDPCPCGSRKKYKKCCLSKDIL